MVEKVEPEPQEGALTGGFRLGDWWVTPALGRIAGPEGERHVAPRAMDLLLFLARNAGRVKSRDEILDAVWHDEVVAGGVIFRHVSALRQLLGDDASNPRFIETIPKRGYRLIASVANGAGETDSPTAQRAPDAAISAAVCNPSTARRLVPWCVTVAALAVAALAVVAPWRPVASTPEAGATDPALWRDPGARRLFFDSLVTDREPEPSERAMELLRAVAERDPEFVAAWESLSETFSIQGSYDGSGEAASDGSEVAMQPVNEIAPMSSGVAGPQVAPRAGPGGVAVPHEVAAP